MSTVLVALIVAGGAAFSAWWNTRQRRRDKKEDWAREDAVAAQAAEAARLLLAENKKVAATAAVTNNKLDIIHTLVNSNMTAAMQAEYDATVREIAMMKEVIALNQAAGREPSPEAIGAIEATQTKINELQAALADRLKQAEVVEQQQQQQQQGAS